MHRPSDNLGRAYVETAEKLRGRERRIYMAQIVSSMGKGGQRYAEQEFKWNRGTIRRGVAELKGKRVEKTIETRGRKAAEHHLPNLLPDMTEILTDNPAISTRKMMNALIDLKQYDGDTLPSRETVRRKMRHLQSETETEDRDKTAKHPPPDLLADMTEILRDNPVISTRRMIDTLINVKQHDMNTLPSREILRRKMRDIKTGTETRDHNKTDEHHLPNLLADMAEILRDNPVISTRRMINALIDLKQYDVETLPSREILRRKMRDVQTKMQ